MESQPQNPEFRINPENFHPCLQTANNKGADQTVHAAMVSFLTSRPISVCRLNFTENYLNANLLPQMLFVDLYVPVNNFSVMSGQVFLFNQY